jgi:hypothetical protein
MPTAPAEGATALMQRIPPGMSEKSFWEMSKHPSAKRLHCEGAKVRVSITNKNEIKREKAK